ncbi:MAG: peptidase domain-containing ABC transporter [Oscillospiraceae bacterium]|nr:peptidase domain-containing ABC transporter [Oscillospiraceae bacterium]
MKHTYLIQHDSCDCAAACLTMICDYFGLKASMAKVREIIGTDKSGTSGLGLVKGYKTLGFNVNAVKTKEKQNLNKDLFPCIANVKTEDSLHYIVVYGMKKDKYIVADPKIGKRVLSSKYFLEIWTGVLFLATPGKTFQKGNQRKTFSMISSFLSLLNSKTNSNNSFSNSKKTNHFCVNWYSTKYQKHLLCFIVLFSILGILLGLASSFYYKILIDTVMPAENFYLLKTASLVFLFIGVVSAIITVVKSYIFNIFCNKIDLSIIISYYNLVLHLPLNFFNSRSVGEILSRLNNAYEIKNSIAVVTIDTGINIAMVIGCGILLCKINFPMFSVFLLTLLLYTVIIHGFRKRLKEKTRDLLEKNSQLQSVFIESISGIETVKTLGVFSRFEQLFKKNVHNFFNEKFSQGKLFSLESFLIQLVSVSCNVFVLWLGIYNVMSNRLSFGEFLTFNALIIYFMGPAGQLVQLQTVLQTSWINFCRLFDVMDLPTEKQRQEIPIQIIPDLFLPIALKCVDFRYGSRKLVFSNLNMNIEAGEFVAIVGASGAGKSTIPKLLMNFYQIEAGQIFFGPYPIQEIDVEFLRSRIAFLPQTTTLFSGTLEENIRQNSSVSDSRFKEVCEMCCVNEFVRDLPGGYGFKVLEHGNNFSGGQKQRIALARSLLRPFDIFIMDEATSGVDSVTERLIMDVLFNKLNRATVILITHRLSLVSRCRRIFVVENGTIVEAGSHEELIAAGGFYNKMQTAAEF